MSIDLSPLAAAPRLLFSIALKPLQGQRFQPTGFPGLGAATFRSPAGESLLVESAQSMANRLERTIWDDAADDLVHAAKGISHVKVTRPDGGFLTDTILEAHRLNSPYLLEATGRVFFDRLGGWRPETGRERRKLGHAAAPGSLLHGVFLAKKGWGGVVGGWVAASGGVKNDHVNPSGDTKAGFGNVPFARDEFSADRITLYVNLDLAQLRGYGLPPEALRLLVVLALRWALLRQWPAPPSPPPRTCRSPSSAGRHGGRLDGNQRGGLRQQDRSEGRRRRRDRQKRQGGRFRRSGGTTSTRA
ncbi:MAG: type I-U CRISPR-associated protein Cas7 [Betaproteobacteria bacterium]|nr:type I-U CRISPR-associated protein Cas7 [Betaproteobacteria bacterium]